MKMRSKLVVGLLAVAATFGVLLPIRASATTVYGLSKSMTVNGVTYTGQTYTYDSGQYVYGETSVRASQAVPAGYIWTQVTLYEGARAAGSSSGYTKETLSMGYSAYYKGGRNGYSYYATGSFKAFDPIRGSYSGASTYTTPSLMF